MLCACQNKDLFDPEESERIIKETYAANFQQLFGNVDATKVWDMSSTAPRYTNGATRADDSYKVQTSRLSLQYGNEVLNHFLSHVKEGVDNREQATAFIMTVPDNPFCIVPLYVNSKLKWSLYAKVGNRDIKIWTRGTNMQKRTKTKLAWSKWSDVTVTANTPINENTQYQARWYTLNTASNPLPVGEKITFYLKIDKGVEGLANEGEKQTSLNRQMLCLTDCPRPDGIPAFCEYRVIGVEDTKHSNSSSDHDLNDFIFLIYGETAVPNTIDIEEGEPITEVVSKRYMIEDLGSTDDFDFNDIVVDVESSHDEVPVYVDGEFDNWMVGETTQTAIIRHLGGILPFSLKIGNTQLEEMQGQMERNPDTRYEVFGWIPSRNNISCTVKGVVSDTPVVIPFPEAGEVPMIIAWDNDVRWMAERVHIPADWTK